MIIEDKEGLLKAIDERIQIGEDLLEKVQRGGLYEEDAWYHWHEENSMTIKQYFNPEENDITNKYLKASPSARTMMDAVSDKGDGAENEILDRLSNLRLVKKLSLLLNTEKKATHMETQTQKFHPTKVFIIHGHDRGLREEVARVLTKLGLEPIILN